MRYDFITDEIIQKYKFFGIQFDNNQRKYAHSDGPISIPALGTQFGKKIGKKK